MKKLILFLFLLFATIGWSQNPTPFQYGIKPNRIVPVPLTTTQIAALPTQATGTIVYNTTLGFWQYYDGDSWELFGSSGTQTLEDVLAAGNTSSNFIYLIGTAGNGQFRGEDLQFQNSNNYGTFGANQIDFTSSSDPWSSFLSLQTLNFQNTTSSLSAEYGKNGISFQDNALSNFTTLDRVDQYLNFYNTPDATETSYTKSAITYSNGTSSRRSQLNFNNFYLRFNDDDLGGQLEIKSPTSLNNVNEYIFPDSSTSTGVSYIPISVNGEFADADGNIEISGIGGSDLNTTTLAGNFTEQNIEFQAGAGLDFFDGTYTMNVMQNTLSANRNIGFPNTSGTLLAKVNGESSDSNGNVQVSLSDITSVGATTSNAITINGINGPTLIDGGYYETTQTSSGNKLTTTPNLFSFQRDGFYYNIVPPFDLTATRNIDFPDASGTIALSVNNNVPASNGNISIDADNIPESTTRKWVSSAEKTSWNSKVDSNASISAGTGTKVTYDTKGLVTSSTSLSESDIPTLNATKIGDGSVSTTEFQYINSVTSNVQTQINNKENRSSYMSQSTSRTLDNTTSLQKIFNVGTSGNGSITVTSGRKYKANGWANFSNLTSTSKTMSFGILGTSTASYFSGLGIGVVSTAVTAGQMNQLTGYSANLVTTASATTGARLIFEFEFNCNSTGTFIPAVSFTTAQANMNVDSAYFQITDIGSSSSNASSDID